MDGEDELASQRFGYQPTPFDFPPDLCARFTAEEYREVRDASNRRTRIADLVSVQIVPRLAFLHAAVQAEDHPSPEEIAELARLVLSPDGREAAAYVAGLKERGLSVDMLFAELLEPAAQLLGQLWEQDEIDFIDVTLGVGRLQALLSVFNCTHELAASSERRSILMLTVPGEQHSFGIAMVERFLGAGGWRVSSERETQPRRLAALVEHQAFAVAGVTLSNRCNLDKAAAAIATIRKRSCNRKIGIMVGGPVFSSDPGLADAIGADGTASTAPTAVVLAQKLLDRAIAAEPAKRRLPARPARRAGGSVAQYAN
jgi:methanogenic corrinoid protein MtbC1